MPKGIDHDVMLQEAVSIWPFVDDVLCVCKLKHDSIVQRTNK